MEEATRIVVAAGRAAGLDCTDAHVLRVRSSTLIALPHACAIARVEPPDALDVARRQVAVARFYAARGAPTARLLPGIDQPFVHESGVATFWERLVATGASLSPSGLGRTLRSLHDLAAPPLDALLPALDPFTPTHYCLANAGPQFPREQLDGLASRLEELERRWPSLCGEDPLGVRLVHGDLTVDNVVVTAKGPVLVDLELAGVGPASWDFTAPAVAVRRYGQQAAHFRRLRDAYGADPTAWDGFDLLCDIYEVLVVAWCVECCRRSPEMQKEAGLRLESFLGHTRERWTLL